LSPGDLVFFDSTGPDGVIDHVGIYLGVDNAGRDRVLSSRNSLRGPTMLDAASGSSPSTLQGSGWMPDGFRAARRF
jgi:cell wall-associated NlpC family hydrolase